MSPSRISNARIELLYCSIELILIEEMKNYRAISRETPPRAVAMLDASPSEKTSIIAPAPLTGRRFPRQRRPATVVLVRLLLTFEQV
jgi:hypothetical protein